MNHDSFLQIYINYFQAKLYTRFLNTILAVCRPVDFFIEVQSSLVMLNKDFLYGK